MSSSWNTSGGRREHTGAGEASARGAVGAAPAAPLFRLRPNHGVVFLEFEISTNLLGQTAVWLLEETVDDEDGERRVLVPLERESISDGTAWHPITHMPLRPEQTLWLNGYDGIAPYMGKWIPVPYLRLLPDRQGAARLDNGPLNWVRMYLVPPEGDLRDADRLNVVLAVDTRLSDASRSEDGPYLAPTNEDATFASTFALASNPDDLAYFLGADWVDGWLSESCRRQAAEGLSDGQELAHIACYMALIATLARLGTAPQFRFYNSLNRDLTKDRDGLELVVDIGSGDVTAFLVGRQALDPGDAPSVARPLGVRELSRPDRVNKGGIGGFIEFDEPPLGNPRFSRLSGRSDACRWPSSVRIGNEARRLALRTNATDGITGSGDFLRFAADAAPAQRIWRFSTDEEHRTGAMAVSSALDYLTEDGRFANLDASSAPAVRPRFSKSALVGLFFGEIVLHAVAQMARPQQHGLPSEAAPLPDLQSIKLALPVSISEEEQRTILARARDGVDLVWRLQGWDKDTTGTAPAKPKLHATVGADLSGQLLYIENEVESRFNGDFLAFARTSGRRNSVRNTQPATLKVASIDVDKDTTTLLVAEYEVSELGNIHPVLSRAQRTPPGASSLQRVLLERFLLPALERRLSASGLPSAGSFLREITGRAPVVWQMDDSDFALRFEQKVLEPAALGLLHLYAEAIPGAARGIETVNFATLVELGGGRMAPLSALFDDAATRAGASGFSLASCFLPVTFRELKALIASELRTIFEPVAVEIDGDDCDVVIVAGRLASAADVSDALLAALPIGPHRLVVQLTPLDLGSPRALSLREQNRLLGVLGLLAEQGQLIPADFTYRGERLLDTSRGSGEWRPRAIPDYGASSRAASAETDAAGETAEANRASKILEER